MILIHPQTAFYQESATAITGRRWGTFSSHPAPTPWAVSRRRRRGDIFLAAHHGTLCRDGSSWNQENFPWGIAPCLAPNMRHFPRKLNVASTSCQTQGEQLCCNIHGLNPRPHGGAGLCPTRRKWERSWLHPWGCSHQAALNFQVEATSPLTSLWSIPGDDSWRKQQVVPSSAGCGPRRCLQPQTRSVAALPAPTGHLSSDTHHNSQGSWLCSVSSI